MVYSNHPYAFHTNGNVNDIPKITYEDVLLEFKNFKSRDMYLISNNLETVSYTHLTLPTSSWV